MDQSVHLQNYKSAYCLNLFDTNTREPQDSKSSYIVCYVVLLFALTGLLAGIEGNSVHLLRYCTEI